MEQQKPNALIDLMYLEGRRENDSAEKGFVPCGNFDIWSQFVRRCPGSGDIGTLALPKS